MKEPKTYYCKHCGTEHLDGQQCTCIGVAREKGKTFICDMCKREWIKGQECCCEMLKFVSKKW
jgi:hypothetical protein